MRSIRNPRLELGEVRIANIKPSIKSRVVFSAILVGLCQFYPQVLKYYVTPTKKIWSFEKKTKYEAGHEKYTQSAT